MYWWIDKYVDREILNNNIEASVENLIESANNNGGEDNISAIIIEIDWGWYVRTRKNYSR